MKGRPTLSGAPMQLNAPDPISRGYLRIHSHLNTPVSAIPITLLPRRVNRCSSIQPWRGDSPESEPAAPSDEASRVPDRNHRHRSRVLLSNEQPDSDADRGKSSNTRDNPERRGIPVVVGLVVPEIRVTGILIDGDQHDTGGDRSEPAAHEQLAHQR